MQILMVCFQPHYLLMVTVKGQDPLLGCPGICIFLQIVKSVSQFKMMTVDPPNDTPVFLFMLSHTLTCSSSYQEVESTALFLTQNWPFDLLAKNEAKVVISMSRPKNQEALHTSFSLLEPCLGHEPKHGLTAVMRPHGPEQESPLGQSPAESAEPACQLTADT